MKKNIREFETLERFFDDDPTDELPVLSLEDMADLGADAPDTTETTGQVPILNGQAKAPTSHEGSRRGASEPRSSSQAATSNSSSLRRLEAEVQALQTGFIDLETDLRRRDDEIEHLEAELQQRSQQAEELQASLTAAETEREQLSEEHAALTAQADELRAALDDGSRLQSDAAAQSAKLEAELTAAQESLAALGTDREQHAEAMKDADSEREKLRQQLLQAEGDNAQLRSKLMDLEHYIAGRRDRWRSLQGERDQQARSIRALEKAAAKKTSQLDGKSAEIERLQAELGTFRETVDQLRQELTASRAASAELQTQIDTSHREAEQLAAELLDARSSGGELDKRLAERDAEIDRLEQVNKLAETSIAEMCAALDEANAGLAERDQRIAGLEANAQTQAEELKEQLDRFTALETQLSEERESVTQLREELAGERKIIAELHRELESGQAETSVFEQKIRDLGSELQAAESLLNESQVTSQDQARLAEESRENLEILRKEHTELVKQRDELATQLAASEADIVLLKESKRELLQDVADQRELVGGLRDELAEKTAVIESHESDTRRLAELEQSIRSLDARLAQSTHRENLDLDRDITRLMVRVGGKQGVKYPLYKETMTIGRAADSDIQIRRQYISRHHARLRQDDGETFIEDLGSRNGVLVNATPVERQQLRNGDLVDIGRIQFKYIDLMASNGESGNA